MGMEHFSQQRSTVCSGQQELYGTALLHVRCWHVISWFSVDAFQKLSLKQLLKMSVLIITCSLY